MKSFRSLDSILRFVPFFIIAFIIPLVKIHISVPHNKEIAEVLIKSRWYDDYFCLIKVCFLYFAVVLALIILLSDRISKCEYRVNNFKFPEVFYLLFPFAVCVLLSTIFSRHRISAAFGIVDQYEGGLTIMLYLIILVFSYLLITENSHIIGLIKITLAASAVIAVIGAMEFTGIIEIDPPYAVSSTIGNSNYVGTYAVLLMPLSVAMVLLETNRAKKILYLLVSYGLVFFLLAGSMSRAGYIAALTIILIGFILLRKAIKAQLGWIIGMVVYSLFILIVMNSVSNGFLFEEIRSLNPFHGEKQQDRVRFEDIKITGNTNAVIKTDRWELKISYDEAGFSFSNKEDEKILYRHNTDNQAIEFEAEPFRDISGYEYYENDLAWLMLIIDDRDIEFVYNNGKLQVVGYNGKLTDIGEAEAIGFKGKESFASGRGYIWSRTFPLLKKALFIGYGPDTIIYEFPQNDIVGKLNYGAIWTIISKPHSWYLQTAFGSGVLSLLFLLVFIIWYIVKSFRNIIATETIYCNCSTPLYRGWRCTRHLISDIATRHLQRRGRGSSLSFVIKHNHSPDLFKTQETNPEQESEKTLVLSACILLSVAGYCVAGIFNDSTVAVSPIFWMLLGFGIRLAWANSSSLKD